MATDTLDKYLQTEQARDRLKTADVLTMPSASEWHGHGQKVVIDRCDAWWRVSVTVANEAVSAYYRPDGDHYMVTDLGEGVRALRLRTGDLYRRSGGPEECRAIRGVWFGDALGSTNVTAADLPDALCRVMLASLRTAQS